LKKQRGNIVFVILIAIAIVSVVTIVIPPLVSITGGWELQDALDYVQDRGYACADVSGNLGIGGSLTVGNDATITDALSVGGPTILSGSLTAKTGRAFITIAAENSLQIFQDQADYVCSGSQMETTINTALQVGRGGTVPQYPGNYWTMESIIVPGSTVYEGSGWGAKIYRR